MRFDGLIGDDFIRGSDPRARTGMGALERIAIVAAALCGCSIASLAAAERPQLAAAAGLSVELDESTGGFDVLLDGSPWLQSAGFTLGDASLRLAGLSHSRGSDKFGGYAAANASWAPVRGVGGISTEVRVYDDRATVVFAQHFAAGVADTSALFRPVPPPPPKTTCGVVMPRSDQAGGHPFLALHNASEESCCDACLSNSSCDTWVLSDAAALASAQTGRTCWLCSGSTGAKPSTDRTTGFVRTPPGAQKPYTAQDRVLSAFPSFAPHSSRATADSSGSSASGSSADAQPAAGALNFITWAGCQIGSSYWGQWSAAGNATKHGSQTSGLRRFSANAKGGTPVLLYDQSLRSIVISPLRNYWVGTHSTARADSGGSPAGAFDAGIKASVESIPAGASGKKNSFFACHFLPKR
jgi:hypothetical protein